MSGEESVIEAEGAVPTTADEGAAAGGESVGDSPLRREDARALRGETTYTDDFGQEAAALAFVRSPHAHAEVAGIDTEAAEAIDGVVAVYTWGDLAESDAPMRLPVRTGPLDCEVPGHPVLAADRVRYDGQPVAAVVAKDRYVAADGVEAVEVEYDPLPVETDPEAAASEDAPTLFEDAPDNVAAVGELGDREATDRAFAAAEEVVSVELENNRLIPSALEPRAALAEHDRTEGFTVTMTSQSPHGHRRKLSHTLGVPERQIRVISPDVGGGFGHKGHHHPGEAMAAWAARELGESVKWTATRSANYREGAHGRDHRTTAELALDADGRFRGLRVDTHAGIGGYALGGGGAMPGWYGRLLASQYEIPAIYCRSRCVFTTTAPVHSYRGAGRPEAIYVTERLVDVAAEELGADPVELRRRNFLDPDGFPHETAVGATYDSGNYEPTLESAVDAVSGLPRGGERDDDGRLRGVGIASYVESTGGGFESGVVRVHPDGGVTVSAGTHDHGQGHGTIYAQIVADEHPVAPEEIEVVEGDTDKIPTGTGTFGSRSTVVGGNAVAESAQEVFGKAREIAAHELDADPGAVETTDSGFRVADGAGEGSDAGDQRVSFAEVADRAYGRGLPEGLSPGLEATTFYELDNTAYTFGTHAVAVAVDPETGEYEVERYVAVDDCGVRVNPRIVEGQVHGGVAQGLGQARSERATYGADGALAASTMLDYALPRASDLPDIETRAQETPSPDNELGVKGIGEGGTVAAPPALVNAVVDAVPGVDHLDMPVTAERVRTAIED
ncbi:MULTISPECIES: xanthine dehydrogenase family protein molybdopterin-binding subunit [Halolamina]|uniref:Carbon-monoxide dehydrogenase large subunit n=1 Tax=Halolamina pelagica TaxID=699431 RepID=A0A1I5QVG3_9EURY|nr:MULTISPECIES: xanthine dehydrogenase family protein molybdopterin-binding subunit [Halolamina]NHX35563.1 xanthine dehydrogenase family protein molybdopterin-binding subunit [Halolamina sp. R1-12]SFP50288.1 carbon-monoxide dehydrogenase large subunit [Halolamina pelagica]